MITSNTLLASANLAGSAASTTKITPCAHAGSQSSSQAGFHQVLRKPIQRPHHYIRQHCMMLSWMACTMPAQYSALPCHAMPCHAISHDVQCNVKYRVTSRTTCIKESPDSLGTWHATCAHCHANVSCHAKQTREANAPLKPAVAVNHRMS